MIAVHTSSMISYLQGDEGGDITLLKECIKLESIILLPPVLSELLSDYKLPNEIYHVLVNLPLLIIKGGYWERVGKLSAKILAKKMKVRIADSLIAQCCIDSDVGLITRDSDFIKFARHTELKLISF